MTKPAKVFVACAASDKAWAKALEKSLARAGFAVASDRSAAKPGEAFARAIRNDLTQSDAFIFVVPALEGEGAGALMELGAAHMMDKPILGLVPERARFVNSDLISKISDGQMLDGSGLSAKEISQRVAPFVLAAASRRKTAKGAAA